MESFQLGHVNMQQASGPLGTGNSVTPTFNSVNVNNLPSYQIVYPDSNNQLASDPLFTFNPLTKLFNTPTIATGITTRTTTGGLTAASVHTTSLADATAGAIVLTLGTAASMINRLLVIKKIDATANTVTIQGNGAETIDGTNTRVLSTQYSSI